MLWTLGSGTRGGEKWAGKCSKSSCISAHTHIHMACTSTSVTVTTLIKLKEEVHFKICLILQRLIPIRPCSPVTKVQFCYRKHSAIREDNTKGHDKSRVHAQPSSGFLLLPLLMSWTWRSVCRGGCCLHCSRFSSIPGLTRHQQHLTLPTNSQPWQPEMSLCLVIQSGLTLCDPVDRSPPGSSVHGDSPGKNTGVGCHALLQGIFPNQWSNLGLPPCTRILYCLSHQGLQMLPYAPGGE